MQEHIWEKEYKNPKLVTGGTEPQTSVKDFFRWLRKKSEKKSGKLENLSLLDLGCGNGKNSNYFASLDETNRAIGIVIAPTALSEARTHARQLSVEHQTQYIQQSIGTPFPFPNDSFDIILDVTSSNSLNEKERTVYLSEAHRVLKPGGYFFVRALSKDGDKNAKNLLKMNPGPEYDTYIMPELGLTERVFSREDFISTYTAGFPSNGFVILEMEKEIHYTKFAGQSYKRNFWIVYLQKK